MTPRFAVSDIIACPSCKGTLKAAEQGYLCLACQLKFRISDGIPVMLLDEAEPLSATDAKRPA